ncbi:MAG: hypothetical protein A3E31_06195 [Candidatus Rokubacteria bacterium RIFCSPHIGHO2_12_FULL_73_22]|nr:MAG: hypothetical protein A3E31_06195 [Candidatus Rokubacteria bacterium RIFCSPHIGHO2_12_FULL_73_22]
MALAYYSLAADREFWTEHWGRHSPAELLRIAEASPLTDLVLAGLPRAGRVLEAGCGLGQYVVLLRARGHRALGADWSLEALAACRRAYPGTPLAVGDLARLPLAPGSLAGYVSLGVVEHDPAGPGALVAEAARVLAPGGALVLSVPYLNGLRRAALPCLRWRSARVRARGGRFYQFAFTAREVRAFLGARGFEVRSLVPYDPARLLRGGLRRLRRRGAGTAPDAPAARAADGAGARAALRRAVRRLLYTPPALALLGHMILATAVKR